MAFMPPMLSGSLPKRSRPHARQRRDPRALRRQSRGVSGRRAASPVPVDAAGMVDARLLPPRALEEDADAASRGICRERHAAPAESFPGADRGANRQARPWLALRVRITPPN